MKKSDVVVDLSIPQRQHVFAIIFIVLKFLKSFVRQAWVFLIPIVMGRSGGNSQWETWELAVAGMGVFSTIWSVIAYFRYYYNLTDDELVIRKGLLKKTNINVPYERIQSVNFKQNFLHQFLNVTEVAIDTAGSGQKEIQIDALTKETASALRKEILERKKRNSSISEIIVEEEIEQESILTLSTSDLLKVGLTQNHFKPVGLIFGLMGSVFAYSWQFDMNPMEIFDSARGYVSDLSWLQLGGVIILLTIFSVLYSIVTTFLNHANLAFYRNDDRFKLIQGLLTRKEVAAMDRKIQFMSWGQNLLQRMFGFYNLGFEQAGAQSPKQKFNKNFSIPGVTAEKIGFVREEWMPEVQSFDNTEGVSVHMFYYTLRYLILGLGAVMAVQLYFEAYRGFAFFLVLLVYSIYKEWLKYKKKRFSFGKKQLYISGGGLGFKYSIMPTYKIQNVSIQQSPYQWRRKLATVQIFTAAGALRIPFVSIERANQLVDFFLYQVEGSRKAWM